MFCFAVVHALQPRKRPCLDGPGLHNHFRAVRFCRNRRLGGFDSVSSANRPRRQEVRRHARDDREGQPAHARDRGSAGRRVRRRPGQHLLSSPDGRTLATSPATSTAATTCSSPPRAPRPRSFATPACATCVAGSSSRPSTSPTQAARRRGAAQRRHARLMTHDLRDVPGDVDPRVVPLAAEQELLPASHPAPTGPGHPGLRALARTRRRSGSCCAASSSGRCCRRQPDGGVRRPRSSAPRSSTSSPARPPSRRSMALRAVPRTRRARIGRQLFAARSPRRPPTGYPRSASSSPAATPRWGSTRTRASRRCATTSASS